MRKTGISFVSLKSNAGLTIGYDGPVRAEPFNQPLRDMDNRDALAATHRAMTNAFKLVE